MFGAPGGADGSGGHHDVDSSSVRPITPWYGSSNGISHP
jgi:hypothetical protein